MDIQVQELITKIKRDGIESATAESAKIRQDAETEAKRIIDAAKREASKITEKAKQDAERSEKAGMAALGQASRNLLLVFRDEVQALLDRIVAEQVKDAYGEDALKKVIPEMLSSWSPKEHASLDVLLSAASLTKLKSFFETKLAKEMKKGLELRSDAGLTAGFKIANKDGSAYYDFSAESVAEMLCAYLNPRLAETLRDAVKDE